MYWEIVFDIGYIVVNLLFGLFVVINLYVIKLIICGVVGYIINKIRWRIVVNFYIG